MVFFLSGILAVIAVVFLANNEHVGPPLIGIFKSYCLDVYISFISIGMWTGLLISMQIYLAAMALISYSSSAVLFEIRCYQLFIYINSLR